MICKVSPVQELQDGELVLNQTRKPAAPCQHMKEGPRTGQPVSTQQTSIAESQFWHTWINFALGVPFHTRMHRHAIMASQ
jgi:hypothetical protein